MSKFGEPWELDMFDHPGDEDGDSVYDFYILDMTQLHRAIECVNACAELSNPRQDLNTIYHIAKAIASCRYRCPDALQVNIDNLQTAVQGLPR